MMKIIKENDENNEKNINYINENNNEIILYPSNNFFIFQSYSLLSSSLSSSPYFSFLSSLLILNKEKELENYIENGIVSEENSLLNEINFLKHYHFSIFSSLKFFNFSHFFTEFKKVSLSIFSSSFFAFPSTSTVSSNSANISSASSFYISLLTTFLLFDACSLLEENNFFNPDYLYYVKNKEIYRIKSENSGENEEKNEDFEEFLGKNEENLIVKEGESLKNYEKNLFFNIQKINSINFSSSSSSLSLLSSSFSSSPSASSTSTSSPSSPYSLDFNYSSLFDYFQSLILPSLLSSSIAERVYPIVLSFLVVKDFESEDYGLSYFEEKKEEVEKEQERLKEIEKVENKKKRGRKKNNIDDGNDENNIIHRKPIEKMRKLSLKEVFNIKKLDLRKRKDHRNKILSQILLFYHLSPSSSSSSLFPSPIHPSTSSSNLSTLLSSSSLSSTYFLFSPHSFPSSQPPVPPPVSITRLTCSTLFYFLTLNRERFLKLCVIHGNNLKTGKLSISKQGEIESKKKKKNDEDKRKSIGEIIEIEDYEDNIEEKEDEANDSKLISSYNLPILCSSKSTFNTFSFSHSPFSHCFLLVPLHQLAQASSRVDLHGNSLYITELETLKEFYEDHDDENEETIKEKRNLKKISSNNNKEEKERERLKEIEKENYLSSSLVEIFDDDMIDNLSLSSSSSLSKQASFYLNHGQFFQALSTLESIIQANTSTFSSSIPSNLSITHCTSSPSVSISLFKNISETLSSCGFNFTSESFSSSLSNYNEKNKRKLKEWEEIIQEKQQKKSKNNEILQELTSNSQNNSLNYNNLKLKNRNLIQKRRKSLLLSVLNDSNQQIFNKLHRDLDYLLDSNFYSSILNEKCFKLNQNQEELIRDKIFNKNFVKLSSLSTSLSSSFLSSSFLKFSHDIQLFFSGSRRSSTSLDRIFSLLSSYISSSTSSSIPPFSSLGQEEDLEKQEEKIFQYLSFSSLSLPSLFSSLSFLSNSIELIEQEEHAHILSPYLYKIWKEISNEMIKKEKNIQSIISLSPILVPSASTTPSSFSTISPSLSTLSSTISSIILYQEASLLKKKGLEKGAISLISTQLLPLLQKILNKFDLNFPLNNLNNLTEDVIKEEIKKKKMEYLFFNLSSVPSSTSHSSTTSLSSPTFPSSFSSTSTSSLILKKILTILSESLQLYSTLIYNHSSSSTSFLHYNILNPSLIFSPSLSSSFSSRLQLSNFFFTSYNNLKKKMKSEDWKREQILLINRLKELSSSIVSQNNENEHYNNLKSQLKLLQSSQPNSINSNARKEYEEKEKNLLFQIDKSKQALTNFFKHINYLSKEIDIDQKEREIIKKNEENFLLLSLINYLNIIHLFSMQIGQVYSNSSQFFDGVSSPSSRSPRLFNTSPSLNKNNENENDEQELDITYKIINLWMNNSSNLSVNLLFLRFLRENSSTFPFYSFVHLLYQLVSRLGYTPFPSSSSSSESPTSLTSEKISPELYQKYSQIKQLADLFPSLSPNSSRPPDSSPSFIYQNLPTYSFLVNESFSLTLSTLLFYLTKSHPLHALPQLFALIHDPLLKDKKRKENATRLIKSLMTSSANQNQNQPSILYIIQSIEKFFISYIKLAKIKVDENVKNQLIMINRRREDERRRRRGGGESRSKEEEEEERDREREEQEETKKNQKNQRNLFYNNNNSLLSKILQNNSNSATTNSSSSSSSQFYFKDLQPKTSVKFHQLLQELKIAPPILTQKINLQRTCTYFHSPSSNASNSLSSYSSLFTSVLYIFPSFSITENGLSRPKIITLLGSDGKYYKELVKSDDDVRQDAVMEQVFDMINKIFLYSSYKNKLSSYYSSTSLLTSLFSSSPFNSSNNSSSSLSSSLSGSLFSTSSSCKKNYQKLRMIYHSYHTKLWLRTYKIVPLTAQSGIIEWVNDTQPFGHILTDKTTGLHSKYDQHSCLINENYEEILKMKKRYDERLYNSTPSQNIPNSTPHSTTSSPPLFSSSSTFKPIPKPMSHLDCRELMRTSVTSQEKKQNLLHIYHHFTPLFGYYFIESSSNSIDWLKLRINFINSVSSTSIAGYLLGIGDRHAYNILIDQHHGDVIHIDFGIVFEQGRNLTTPETVPFRLTREILHGMGMYDSNNIYKKKKVKKLRRKLNINNNLNESKKVLTRSNSKKRKFTHQDSETEDENNPRVDIMDLEGNKNDNGIYEENLDEFEEYEEEIEEFDDNLSSNVLYKNSLYKKSCIEVMNNLRAYSSNLLTILEVIIHDPLYKWTLSPYKVKNHQENRNAVRSRVNEIPEEVEDNDANNQKEFAYEAAERTLKRIQLKLKGEEEILMRKLINESSTGTSISSSSSTSDTPPPTYSENKLKMNNNELNYHLFSTSLPSSNFVSMVQLISKKNDEKNKKSANVNEAIEKIINQLKNENFSSFYDPSSLSSSSTTTESTSSSTSSSSIIHEEINVETLIDLIINEAYSVDNLSNIFCGWAPWL